MNKAELVSAVAEKSGQSAAAVGSVLAAFEDVVTSTVAGGGKVQIPGFLSFERAERAARTGPQPGHGSGDPDRRCHGAEGEGRQVLQGRRQVVPLRVTVTTPWR